MLQRNVPEEISVRRRIEYKAWKKKVKELVYESKMKIDEEFGRDREFCEKLTDNRKFCRRR